LFRQNPYDRGNVIADFDSIKISLASPETSRSWSKGEVRRHHCRTSPERDGLFGAKIFGP
jgi:DNA-directed RNA polymerase subunit beta'